MTASRNKNNNNGSNGHTSKANQSNGTPPTMSTAVSVNGGNGKTLYARRSLRVIDPESHVSSS
jgi:hypothetical protein